MPKALTPGFVATVTVTKRTDFPDATVPGLVLRVTPNGVKTWCLRYRTRTGQAKRFTMGSVDALSLPKARLKARQTLNAIAAGNDPAADKRTSRVNRTMGALIEDYLTHAQSTRKSWKQADWMLRTNVLPLWKDIPAKAITRRDVRALAEGIVKRGAPVLANRAVDAIRGVFSFGMKRDWLDANPASQIEPLTKEHSRERVLTDEEIKQVWTLCDQEPPVFAAFVRLRLLTAQRGGELAQLKWSDFDDDGKAFTIPATIAKNGRAHRVPLSKLAIAQIETIPRLNEWLFMGLRLSTLQHAVTRVRDRMTTLARQAGSRTAVDFRGHDLRRTAATKMAQAGVPEADISRVLNHSAGGPSSTPIYQRWKFDPEKRVALETLARVIQGILDEAPGKSVLPFVRS